MSRPRSRPSGPIALVCSSGGHLAQLVTLKPWWDGRDRLWVTFGTEDARTILETERAYWCANPTNRSLVKLAQNFFLAVRICLRERPTLIVSTGAAVAVPFFYVGKLLGAQTIFIEVVDRVARPSLTGRLVRPVTDAYAVQWAEQLRFYPRATLIGRLM